MPRVRKSISDEELIKISKKIWANVEDIMNIGAIGKNKAREVYKEIKREHKTNVNNSFVPMNKVLDYFNISIESLGIKHGQL